MKKARKARPKTVDAELADLAALSDRAIDTADIPEGREWHSTTRGRFYRPLKTMVTIRLDADVVAWFKQRDGRYQTAVNRVLREYMTSHRLERKRGHSERSMPPGRRALRA